VIKVAISRAMLQGLRAGAGDAVMAGVGAAAIPAIAALLSPRGRSRANAVKEDVSEGTKGLGTNMIASGLFGTGVGYLAARRNPGRMAAVKDRLLDFKRSPINRSLKRMAGAPKLLADHLSWKSLSRLNKIKKFVFPQAASTRPQQSLFW